jgi:hypothetical protein
MVPWLAGVIAFSSPKTHFEIAFMEEDLLGIDAAAPEVQNYAKMIRLRTVCPLAHGGK